VRTGMARTVPVKFRLKTTHPARPVGKEAAYALMVQTGEVMAEFPGGWDGPVPQLPLCERTWG